MFRYFDVDGNGKISKTEFSKLRKSAERFGCIFGTKEMEEGIFRELALMTIENEIYAQEMTNLQGREPSTPGKSGGAGYPETPGTGSKSVVRARMMKIVFHERVCCFPINYNFVFLIKSSMEILNFCKNILSIKCFIYPTRFRT